MAIKITLVGAGSVVFAKNLIGDILQFPELSDAHICLMDIDPARLKVAEVMTQRMIAKLGVPASVSATTDRRKAVAGSHYVICTIQVGGYRPGTVIDFEIPKKYGLEQTIGDTLGVGGVFRALRTIPAIVALARDIADGGAPGCLLLNYTNPMAMNCRAVQRATGTPHVGLCHSVQGTSAQLAGFAGLPLDDVNYLVAGINHMAFFLKFEYRGQDAYPLLFKALEDPARRTELVRFEMMRRLGYFVTESSEHQSEYVPYFIHHGEEMVRRFNIPIDEYLRRCEAILATWERSEKDLLGGDAGDIVIAPQGKEYGSYIIHSIETDVDRVIYGNVPNRGLITNLPKECCVEVPCLVNRNGLQPTVIGDLPPQLAAICRTNINVQELAVEAALTGNREAVYHAVMLDPHAGATLSLDKIWALCDELIAAHQEAGLLGNFHPVVKNTGRAAAGIADCVIARLVPASPLEKDCTLRLEVENPRSSDFQADFTLRSLRTPLKSRGTFAVRAPAGGAVQIPIPICFAEEPGASEKILLSTEAASVLAIGADFQPRRILRVQDGAPARFGMNLAGFPAVEGDVFHDADGVTVRVKVNDSMVPETPDPSYAVGSRVELYFSRTDGRNSHAFFLSPCSSSPHPRIWESSRREFLEEGTIRARVAVTVIDYQLEAFFPWSALQFEEGDFLFDCRVDLLALGDAHSGGYCRLNDNQNDDCFSLVTRSRP